MNRDVPCDAVWGVGHLFAPSAHRLQGITQIHTMLLHEGRTVQGGERRGKCIYQGHVNISIDTSATEALEVSQDASLADES